MSESGWTTNELPDFIESTINHYNKIFNSGIRINVGDDISIIEIEDVLMGYNGEEKQEIAEKWIEDMYHEGHVECESVLFIPRNMGEKSEYTEVLISVKNTNF